MAVDSSLLDISKAIGQNKLATMLSDYLTKEELLQIDLKRLAEFYLKYKDTPFHNSAEGIKSDNTMYQIKFESKTELKLQIRLKSKVDNPGTITGMLDYLAFKINYRGAFDTVIKVLPNPMNHKYVCLVFAKAINYSLYKNTLDQLYNKETIYKNFSIMVKSLLATRKEGAEDFDLFFQHLLEGKVDINSGCKETCGKFEFCVDIDYIVLFSFYVKDTETNRMEIIFLENIDIEVHRLLVILSDIFELKDVL